MRGIVQIPFLIILAIVGLTLAGGGGYYIASQSRESDDTTKKQNEDILNSELRQELEELKKAFAEEQEARNQQEFNFPQSSFNSIQPPKIEEPVSEIQEETKTYTLSNGLVVDEFGNIVENPHLNKSSESSSSQEETISEITKRVSNSIVLIQTLTSQGSGFVFDQGKYILTNAHVVEGYSSVKVFLNGNSYDGTVVGSSPGLDVAIVTTGNTNFPNIKLANSDLVSAGDEILTFGFPEYFSSVVTVSKGIVSAVYPDKYIQIDAPIHHGNSGGPSVNKKGEVVGINTLGYGGGGSGLGYAIPSNVVKSVTSQILNGTTGSAQSVNSTITPNSYPPAGSTVDIPNSIVWRISINPELSCSEMFSLSNEKQLCEMYTLYYSSYTWNIQNNL